VTGAEVGVEGMDMGEHWWVPEESPGRYRLEGLPGGRVVLFAEVGGRRFTVEHDTTRPEARIRVPVTGSVTVTYRYGGPPAPHRIRLAPLDEAGTELVSETEYGRRTEVRLPAVFPGRYRVDVEASESEDETGPWRRVREGPEITVVAGETTALKLED
jgi:hypothetical protein